MIQTLIPTTFKKISPRTRWLIAGVMVAAGLGTGIYQFAWAQPKVISPTAPALGVTTIDKTHPMSIIFSHPVDPHSLRYALHPDLKGAWSLRTDLLTAQASLTFTPAESPALDTRYTVELHGIKSRLGGSGSNYLLSFQTDTSPIFVGSNPGDGSIDILPDVPVQLVLNKNVVDGVQFLAAITPEVVLDQPTIVEKKILSFAHPTPFQKNTVYTLTISKQTVSINYATQVRTIIDGPTQVLTVTFTTIAAPGIQGYSPTGTAVDPASPIVIEFKQPMDHESTQAGFAINPNVAGSFTWEGDQKMTFTPPAPLTKGQAYAVTEAKSAKAANGVMFDTDFSFNFTTIGAVSASLSPGNGAHNVDPGTAISVSFNQEVDHASAESKFSINPTVAGSFTWNGNAMVFHPTSALGFSTAYTATVAKGIVSVRGLNSTSDFSTKFTTRTQSVTLNVPSYRQAHMYTCMIAAARAALAFRGVNVSEANIIAKVGIDPTKWSGTWGGSDGRWGDPDVAMVGPLDNGAATSPAGKKTTNVNWGYGSHWGPISKALTSYGVSNEVRRGMTVQDIAQAISNGQPVIIWWVNGIWPSYTVNWKTPSGKSVQGVNGLHVQVVRGFTGSIDNPVTFTVTDSGYGYPGHTFDLGTFKAKWAWFGNTGIIVK